MDQLQPPRDTVRRHPGRRMSDNIIKAVAAAAAGGLVGWAANALTLGGRVEAVEKSLQRVESRLEVIIVQGQRHTLPEGR